MRLRAREDCFVVLGGHTRYRLKDAFILKGRDAEVEKIFESEFKFLVSGNQCAPSGFNEIVGLVESSDNVLHIVSYTLGESTVRI